MNSSRASFLRCGLLAALTLLLAGGTNAAQPEELQKVRENRARWAASGVSSYEYAYNKFCECHGEEPPETVVTVSDGAIVRVHHKHADSGREVPARAGSLEYYWTVEDLFALLEKAAGGDATVRARYDATLGYPLQVYVDYQPALVGDEVDVRLTRLDVAAQ
jgi:hypothetical protein